MGERCRHFSIEELPSHLVLEILCSGRLSAKDLVCLELTSKTFGGSHGLYPFKFKSLIDFAAFQLCASHVIHSRMDLNAQRELYDRCEGNWKRVLRFLQSVEQSSTLVETSSGNVFTCGDNSSSCCGHRDTSRPIFRPRLVESLKGIPCKQVAAGLNFTVFLTRQGHVYTSGTNTHGQLGHGDTQDRPTPKIIEALGNVGSVVQIAAGPSYILSVTENGAVYSFGSGANFCLGHGEQHNELQPRAIQKFRRKGVHIVRVSAGDEHAVALDSNGFVYTWGKGYCGALGHGDEIEKTTPEILTSLKNHLAVQVCARKRKTFVLVDSGSVYGFGSMGFGSLGFLDRRISDKVLKPRILDTLRAHRVSQISTGLYHTVVITSRGKIFGFGDNERAQLGHDTLRSCLEPIEIFIRDSSEEVDPIESI
ncbi:probable E3 ubiquitin-protein ligase HERC3 isoform X2 [Abrus precatorius]|uniref:Probable E3 ubiquitin-protein ligase HERC3 isoform X2 n=1 Tax=Abrus precatorius TaxID=3816 RepID=A0A8B8KH10_ABRPR|nr:probable E3 ubiquitin-protein ligase HERC3 isoform X2 [Abrus precatorius]